MRARALTLGSFTVGTILLGSEQAAALSLLPVREQTRSGEPLSLLLSGALAWALRASLSQSYWDRALLTLVVSVLVQFAVTDMETKAQKEGVFGTELGLGPCRAHLAVYL